MTHYKLEHIKESVCLTITKEKQNKSSVAFVGCMGLVMFLLPILTIIFLSIEITFGTILVCILAWLISGYFVRLFLWNKYGKEIFVINENTLEVYYDYKYFKDNRKLYYFTKIDIVFFFEKKIIYANDSDEHYHFTYKHELSELGFKIDEEIIISHEKMPVLEIIDIAKQIKDV